jgi:hypothetical protein
MELEYKFQLKLIPEYEAAEQEQIALAKTIRLSM